MHRRLVTIGIPAYNEEANIAKLLSDIRKQNNLNFELSKIIIVSDASDDQTNSIVLKENDKRLKLIVNHERQGQAYCQNVILDNFEGEILILLNADIRLPRQDCLLNLVAAFDQNTVIKLAHAQITPLTTKSWFGSVLQTSWEIKSSLIKRWNNGCNILASHGAMRAIHKDLALKLRWPILVNEDAYCYLLNKKLGYKMASVSKAVANIYLPSALNDHLKQSRRFNSSMQEQSKYFDSDFLTREYSVPKILLIETLAQVFVNHPLQVIWFVIIWLIAKLKSELGSPTWQIANSTKSAFTYYE